MKTLNNNIQDSYCSEKVVKLLEQKGADILLLTHRTGQLTHSLAIEWIRVNFGVHLYVACKEKDNGEVLYVACGRTTPFTKDEKGIIIDCIPYNPKNSPQEATEAAFDYVLNNLI